VKSKIKSFSGIKLCNRLSISFNCHICGFCAVNLSCKPPTQKNMWFLCLSGSSRSNSIIYWNFARFFVWHGLKSEMTFAAKCVCTSFLPVKFYANCWTLGLNHSPSTLHIPIWSLYKNCGHTEINWVLLSRFSVHINEEGSAVSS
jgi:hypothetical protein